MNKAAFLLSVLVVAACSSSGRGDIADATVLHWENESVTQSQFVKDHKDCLGIRRDINQPRSRISQLLMPGQIQTLPEWDGLWVTFQSNEFQGIGDRVLLSAPSNMSSNSVGTYRRCMFTKGYLLRAS
ncbi:MAG: hypothetical protein LBG89_00240 [Rickettsiales bacterium]|jgi:hypothetical protein|nr:hypothetical protein [Rickettsiales bacterium]